MVSVSTLHCHCHSNFADRKVLVVLEELGLDYKSVVLDLMQNEQKSSEHTDYNPNGRIPTLVDHRNNDLAIWYDYSSLRLSLERLTRRTKTRRESDAIIMYLVEKYDTEHKLSFDKYEDKIQQLQWLFFQASGQG